MPNVPKFAFIQSIFFLNVCILSQVCPFETNLTNEMHVEGLLLPPYYLLEFDYVLSLLFSRIIL